MPRPINNRKFSGLNDADPQYALYIFMIKKTVIGVCGLVFVAAFSLPAFADQSIGYQQYFNEGVKAFKEHDDQKAFRCFKIAQIYDPADEDLNKYLNILDQRGVVLEPQAPVVPPEQSTGYRYYFSEGIKAFQKYDDQKAIRYFKIALIFNSDSKESDTVFKDFEPKARFKCTC